MSEESKKEKKGFISSILEKLDKKLSEKAKKNPCCGSNNEKKGPSCC